MAKKESKEFHEFDCFDSKVSKVIGGSVGAGFRFLKIIKEVLVDKSRSPLRLSISKFPPEYTQKTSTFLKLTYSSIHSP